VLNVTSDSIWAYCGRLSYFEFNDRAGQIEVPPTAGTSHMIRNTLRPAHGGDVPVVDRDSAYLVTGKPNAEHEDQI
jgi:hypothetical protein